MLKDNNIVEMSKALVWAKFKDYSLGQLKVLDTYLSRINARDPDSDFVSSTKQEYAKLMGLKDDIKASQLKPHLRKLLANVVEFKLPGDTGYQLRPIFFRADCKIDPESGLSVISLQCHPDLKQMFFNLAEDGYVRYQLKNIISMKSQYSIRLYSILKDRPFGWTVSVDELRSLLGATNATYSDFRRFRSMILAKAVDEVSRITDLTVTYDLIKTGRTVTSVKFSVKSKSPAIPDTTSDGIEPDEIDTDDIEPYDIEQNNGKDDEYERLRIYMDELPKEFTPEQVDYLSSLASDRIEWDPESLFPHECMVADYLREKVKMMYASPTPVQNKYKWLEKAISENW